jgi:hypothetical protein
MLLALFVLPDSPKKVGEYQATAAQLRIPARSILLLYVSTTESVSYFVFFKDDRREKENFSGTPVLYGG